jgi:hypothetical protein
MLPQPGIQALSPNPTFVVVVTAVVALVPVVTVAVVPEPLYESVNVKVVEDEVAAAE